MSPETILALTSRFLPVPSREAIEESGDAEALDIYFREWHRPAELLYAATCSLSPVLAWERIDFTTRFMGTPGSPSWWQRGPETGKDYRKTKAPITLKNVADRFLDEYTEYTRGNSWYPQETTPYSGPPLEYEAGYGGTTPDEVSEGPTTDEVPAVPVPSALPGVITVTEIPDEASNGVEEQREEPVPDEVPAAAPLGMGVQAAEHLMKRIKQRYPEISLEMFNVLDDGSRVVVGVEHAVEQWIFLSGMGEWLRPSPENAALIDQAIVFGVGMSREVATTLIGRMRQRHPQLIVSWRDARDDGSRVVVGVRYGPGDDDWLDFSNPRQWAQRDEEASALIEQAVLYGGECTTNAEESPKEQ